MAVRLAAAFAFGAIYTAIFATNVDGFDWAGYIIGVLIGFALIAACSIAYWLGRRS